MEQTLSLSCYITEWMRTFKAYSVKQFTYDRLLTSAKALEGFQIASMPIGEITSVDIQKYVNELAEYGYGLSTIKKQIWIVTAPLKQAAALHQIPADPAVGIQLPSRSNVQKRSAQLKHIRRKNKKPSGGSLIHTRGRVMQLSV